MFFLYFTCSLLDVYHCEQRQDHLPVQRDKRVLAPVSPQPNPPLLSHDSGMLFTIHASAHRSGLCVPTSRSQSL